MRATDFGPLEEATLYARKSTYFIDKIYTVVTYRVDLSVRSY